mgnify:CR=1 FL=1
MTWQAADAEAFAIEAEERARAPAPAPPRRPQNAFLRWRAIGTSSSYFLVWSGRDFGLDVELFREPG